MPVYDGKKLAQDKLLDIAVYCIHACQKAPQITGRVELQYEIVTGDDLQPILEAEGILGRNVGFYFGSMLCWQKAIQQGEPPVLLLLGGKNLRTSELVWNCGACGFRTCKEFNKYSRSIENPDTAFIKGPFCMWKTIDYGMACDWACAQAWLHNVTNRIEVASGTAAQSIGYLPECDTVFGLPLGPMKDMFWYSREAMIDLLDYDVWKQQMMTLYPSNWGTFPGHGRPWIKSGQKWWETPKDRVLTDTDMEAFREMQKGVIEDLKELRERVQIDKIKRENE
jgi:uncharacterized ferredoxin-like protein